ncbi:plasmid stabilization protein [Rhizobium sp. FY34]|uniref:FitA-like ribbon-helix-helix domain-containing protein n=1 Tax=Rhizobium sp. FY34 TaxID=2562309 RepID=UPI0010BFD153|nr:plasmid stabilization protein [Rhizobium sp. FY34]
MGDLLIRNIPDAIRQSLTERAERSGRSVSEEVTAILHRELRDLAPSSPERAGHRLRSLMSNEASWTDEEIAAIDAARYAPDRPPPRFRE